MTTHRYGKEWVTKLPASYCQPSTLIKFRRRLLCLHLGTQIDQCYCRYCQYCIYTRRTNQAMDEYLAE